MRTKKKLILSCLLFVVVAVAFGSATMQTLTLNANKKIAVSERKSTFLTPTPTVVEKQNSHLVRSSENQKKLPFNTPSATIIPTNTHTNVSEQKSTEKGNTVGASPSIVVPTSTPAQIATTSETVTPVPTQQPQITPTAKLKEEIVVTGTPVNTNAPSSNGAYSESGIKPAGNTVIVGNSTSFNTGGDSMIITR